MLVKFVQKFIKLSLRKTGFSKIGRRITDITLLNAVADHGLNLLP